MVAGGFLKQPRVRESVWQRARRQKQKILDKLRLEQKPVLNRKIDEMLKQARKKRRVIVTFFRGVGRSIGGDIGSFFGGVGRSISSLLGGR